MVYKITLYHSPDSDDAFMFYALEEGFVKDENIKIESRLLDIETLNGMALRGEVEVSAISFHAYSYVFDKYHILPSGASFGENYGPKVVSRNKIDISKLKGKKIAVPGKLTSATLALKLLLNDFEEVVTPFDKIIDSVKMGEVDGGVLIHEGQLIFQREGLHCVIDLGEWWFEKTKLPLPLGGNIIRKDLPDYILSKFPLLLRESIEYALNNREMAIEFAKKYGRELTKEEVDKFVSMYVNKWTLNYGEEGIIAVKTFLEEGFKNKLIPSVPDFSFLGLNS